MSFRKIFFTMLLFFVVACQTTPNSNDPVIQHKSSFTLSERISKANKAYKDGSLVEAEKIYLGILSSHRNIGEVWFKMGNIYYRSGRYNAAVSAYETVLKLERKHEKAWYNLALSRVGQSIEVIDASLANIDKDSPLYQRSVDLKQRLLNRISAPTTVNYPTITESPTTVR